MKDFKTFLKEEEKIQIDEAASALLLIGLTNAVFPLLFKGGKVTTSLLAKGVKKLWDVNKEMRAKAKDKKEAETEAAKQLNDALKDLDPNSDDYETKLQSAVDDFKKVKNPKKFLKDQTKKAKALAKSIEKENKELLNKMKVDDNVDSAEKETDDAEDKLVGASDNEVGSASDNLSDKQSKEKEAKEKQKELEPKKEKESEDDNKSKEKPENDEIAKKISKLEKGLKDEDDKDRQKKYKEWIKYYSEVKDSDDPDSIKKPEGKPPIVKDKKKQMKESYIKAATFWSDK